ncbi:hypothetical protein N1851_033870 [Merluccius polli]|uniref:Uncharacterized protein n=1 Tax=Merluccius polli TaxID=89951 RepID=A0AA47NN65_MERPO|nr:hypothetical protein N1851_033870 [Merluccius polli]
MAFLFLCQLVLILQITKNLSGLAKGTALWLTYVSNEVGQILMSVLTDQESPALDIMAADLIRRYSDAGVAPSQLLYASDLLTRVSSSAVTTSSVSILPPPPPSQSLSLLLQLLLPLHCKPTALQHHINN